eukprot:933416-Prymnesium_polylepis.3
MTTGGGGGSAPACAQGESAATASQPRTGRSAACRSPGSCRSEGGLRPCGEASRGSHRRPSPLSSATSCSSSACRRGHRRRSPPTGRPSCQAPRASSPGACKRSQERGCCTAPGRPPSEAGKAHAPPAGVPPCSAPPAGAAAPRC